MELDEIKKTVDDFGLSLQKKVQPMHQEAAAATPTPAEEAPAPAQSGEPCVTKAFKKMVSVLSPDYIGHDIKDFIMEFLDTLAPDMRDAFSGAFRAMYPEP